MATLKFIYLLGLALVSMAVTTTDSLKPSSFLPTLPPANASVSNDPCAFSDVHELLDRLVEASQLYNTTFLVESCDNICHLIFGTGNPDMSGMMISYAIQGAVLLIFGPIFLISVILVGGGKNPFSHIRSQQQRPGWIDLFLKLALPTHRVNAFTAVCVLVSMVVRQDSEAPWFEAQFARTLTVYQLFICFVGFASYVSFCPFNSTLAWILQFLLYALAGACSVVQISYTESNMGLILTSEGDENWPDALPTNMLQDCNTVSGYPLIAHRSLLQSNPRLSVAALTMLPIVSWSFITAFLLSCKDHAPSLYRSFVRCVLPLRRASVWCFTGCLSAPEDADAGRLSRGAMVILCAAVIFTAAEGFVIIELNRGLRMNREEPRKYIQDGYEDDDWGFGQVLAVAVWVTWLLDAVFLLLEAFWSNHRLRTRRAQASQNSEPSDQELDSEEPDQVPSSTSESQGQATEVYPLVSHHTPTVELGVHDSPTLRSRPTWPRNDRYTYLPG